MLPRKYEFFERCLFSVTWTIQWETECRLPLACFLAPQYFCNVMLLVNTEPQPLPQRRQWQPAPVLLPGKSCGRRSLEGCSPWGPWGSDMTDFPFTFHFHALEKEMATHSSALAWWIPGMGKPGGLPSLGSHRVGHDWSDLAAAAAVYLFHIAQDNALD